jgi:hypothetical protein
MPRKAPAKKSQATASKKKVSNVKQLLKVSHPAIASMRLSKDN